MNYSTHLFRHLRFTIGKNIHAERSKQKLTLHKLSFLSGVPETLLDRYELGKNELKLNDLFRISCALGLEIKDMFAA